MTEMESREDRREFTKARREQGFQSQAHLDAFYVYYDHTKACGECPQEGPSYWNEADASWQPAMRVCPQGQALFRAESQFSQYAAKEVAR